MKFKKSVTQYEIIEFEFEKNEDISYIDITNPVGKTFRILPFESVAVDYKYDDEGFESILSDNKKYQKCRYSPSTVGEYRIKAIFNNSVVQDGVFKVSKGTNHGYIKVSEKDKRYFCYSDGTSFFPIGINMAFPGTFGISNGDEFGLSDKFKYIGMKQYERWFRECSKNGVNLVRVWLGHEYFNPETEQSGVYDYKQFAKIDKLLELSEKYNIKLKLTLEQFRTMDYERKADTLSQSDDIFRKFNRVIYKGERTCKSVREWLNDEFWQNEWLNKINEIGKRYAYNPNIFAIELWNEMNCIGNVTAWNKKMAECVRNIFPNHMIINSLGSYDCKNVERYYSDFCWHLFDFKQLHSYLDQGAKLDAPTKSPIDALQYCINAQKENNMPFFVAETGAVNIRHSGPFKYYPYDHRGIIFADCVYTPVFLGCAGVGNIWHWDERYVEFKNLYPMYKPLIKLFDGVSFDSENFVSKDYSNDQAYIFILEGNNYSLGYIRNKSDNWKNVLRDLNNPTPISFDFNTDRNLGKLEKINIWEDDVTITTNFESIKICNLHYGVFVKFQSNAG